MSHSDPYFYRDSHEPPPSPGYQDYHEPGLYPPSPSYLPSARESMSSLQTPYGSTANLGLIKNEPVYESRHASFVPPPPTVSRATVQKRRRIIWWIVIVAGVIIAAAAAFVVYKVFVKHTSNNNSSTSTAGGGSSSGGAPSGDSNSNGAGPIYGYDGSTVQSAQGNFVYTNKLGGYWYVDPTNPFANNARAQSTTKPLNETWVFGTDKIHGVNLGGWFVTEPFITPALYQKYPGSLDEWDLSLAMRADTGAGGGISQLETHYQTFITEQDFAQVAGAGLNWVRIPMPFWAIDVWGDEPFLEGVCWKYLLQAFDWARKYGLRINLDLHTAPGSQNGWWHSGRTGSINFLKGVMGVANAQRHWNYVRIITEFISQPQYQNLILIFGVVNEPLLGNDIPFNTLASFYLKTHSMVRAITGVGAGNGPYMSIHDGFQPGLWGGFLPNSDRIALDMHPYFAFGSEVNTLPKIILRPCNEWAGPTVNTTLNTFGFVAAGEFSNAVNDCGIYVNGVAKPATTTNCGPWTNWESWDANTKAGFMNFTMTSMDSLQNYFFWTWKTAPNATGQLGNPMWDYKLGLDNGWIPPDPNAAIGKCVQLGIAPDTPTTGLLPWQTGGAGANSIAAAVSASFPWPPATMVGVNNMKFLPTYTPTGTLETLPPPTYSASVTAAVGNGWFNAQDTTGLYVAVDGCTYPDEYDAVGATEPTTLCAGTAAKRLMRRKPVAMPGPTPMP